MTDSDPLRAQFADNPQPIVTFVTTEHYNLQTERAVTTSETNGRAAIFLATLSSGLVALAFIGQTSDLGPPFYAFAFVLFPVVSFLGTVTFARAIQSSIDDIVAATGILRCRRFYLDFAPGLEAYVHDPGQDLAEAMAVAGAHMGRRQLLLTTAGTLGILDSVLIGVIAGLAARARPTRWASRSRRAPRRSRSRSWPTSSTSSAAGSRPSPRRASTRHGWLAGPRGRSDRQSMTRPTEMRTTLASRTRIWVVRAPGLAGVASVHTRVPLNAAKHCAAGYAARTAASVEP